MQRNKVKEMEEINEDEEDFYKIENLEEYVESDEINGLEEGFMIGYLE
jgi:hypothetical protein